MRYLKTIIPLILVAAVGAWAYYANVASGRQAMDMNMRITSGSTPFPVTVASVERGRITGAVTYTGSVAPLNEEDIYPRVTGRILEMRVYPGDRVERGQIVARLDDVELGSKVREAAAGAAAAEANLAQMESDVAAAHLDIVHKQKELAQMEAEAEYQQKVTARDERLFTKGAIAQQELESSRSMAAATDARLQAARENIVHARAMLASAEKKRDAMAAMLTQSRAMLRTNEVVRDYVNIRASTTGYVVKRLVPPGVLVQPGMAILKIAQMDRVRLQANVGERDVASIRVGSPVTVTTTQAVQPPLPARVTSVFPFVDQGARTAVVEAVVENTGRRFLPGQYVQMEFLTGDRSAALAVPRAAVARLAGKATVWIVADDRTEPREVITGLENAERVEIVQGLADGERVIVQGHEGLYAGARVRDVSAPSAQAQEGHQHGAGLGVKGPDRPAPSEALAPKEHGEHTPPASAESGTAPAPSGAASHEAGHGAGATVVQAGAGQRAAGEPRITLSTVPPIPRVGDNRVRIEVKDPAGAPVTGAKVEVNAGMVGMPGPKVEARPAKEPGTYEATVNLGMAGAWTAEVAVTRPQGGTISAKFNLEAK